MGLSKEFFLGCIIGGAIGDAFGWPVEFLSDSEIIMKYGEKGLTNLIAGKNGLAEITDDTQMSLFTAEGLLIATEGGIPTNVSSYVYEAYLAWLYTQGEYECKENKFLSRYRLLYKKELFIKRSPGLTCIKSLKSGIKGIIHDPINNSKGCGGVMRVAPIGLMFQCRQSFQIACECAAITHGHPSGYLSAGILACIISEILKGKDIEESVGYALLIAKEYKGHEECVDAINKALSLVPKDIDTKLAIKQIGEGWVGEEALAIAIYCAIKYKDEFESAIIASTNHDGDSDSTGAITGNILGAYLGVQSIPKKWVEKIELLDIMAEIAEDIYLSVKNVNAFGAVSKQIKKRNKKIHNKHF